MKLHRYISVDPTSEPMNVFTEGIEELSVFDCGTTEMESFPSSTRLTVAEVSQRTLGGTNSLS